MIFSFSNQSVQEYKGDAFAVWVEKRAQARKTLFRSLDRQFEGHLLASLEHLFPSDQPSTVKNAILPTLGWLPVSRLLCLPLDTAAMTLDEGRLLGAVLMRAVREHRLTRIGLILPPSLSLKRPEEAEAFFEGMYLGAYQFHTYKTAAADPAKGLEVAFEICGISTRERVAWTRLIERAKALATAISLARDLVNTPSADMHPGRLVEVAQEIAARSPGCTCTHLGVDRMRELGMGPTLAVGRGSIHEPQGVHLIYRPKGRAKKRVAIVGKAVTFDSGGLSIKSADGMMTMKIDMAGAATVLGLFELLCTLKLPIEVHGIFLAVENMPSGNAYRPGDIVRAMNGKTIEVLNTDAEGRLTLADALTYAVETKPDVLIDIATLTGAAVVALGEDITALFASDPRLEKALLRAGIEASEPVCPLPLYAPYQELIKSKIADLKNYGGRAAGAMTAALFLSHFVGKTPWAHLDIAGPSYAEREHRADTPHGGTGVGVRLLARYLQALS
jgi:leucyl aminopeptidase